MQNRSKVKVNVNVDDIDLDISKTVTERFCEMASEFAENVNSMFNTYRKEMLFSECSIIMQVNCVNREMIDFVAGSHENVLKGLSALVKNIKEVSK